MIRARVISNPFCNLVVMAFVAALVTAALWATSGQAAPAAKSAANKNTAKDPGGKVDPAAPKGFRKKELNFEERVIEGLSNRGYESLSQTGSNDGLKGEKLYRKRAEFDEDSKSLLREMEYLK